MYHPTQCFCKLSSLDDVPGRRQNQTPKLFLPKVKIIQHPKAPSAKTKVGSPTPVLRSRGALKLANDEFRPQVLRRRVGGILQMLRIDASSMRRVTDTVSLCTVG